MGFFRRKQSSSGSADFVDTAGKKSSSPNPESPVQIQTNNLCHNDSFKHSNSITDIDPLSIPPIPSSAKLSPTSQQPKKSIIPRRPDQSAAGHSRKRSANYDFLNSFPVAQSNSPSTSGLTIQHFTASNTNKKSNYDHACKLSNTPENSTSTPISKTKLEDSSFNILKDNNFNRQIHIDQESSKFVATSTLFPKTELEKMDTGIDVNVNRDLDTTFPISSHSIDSNDDTKNNPKDKHFLEETNSDSTRINSAYSFSSSIYHNFDEKDHRLKSREKNQNTGNLLKNFDKTAHSKLLGSSTLGPDVTSAVTSTPITIENVQIISSPRNPAISFRPRERIVPENSHYIRYQRVSSVSLQDAERISEIHNPLAQEGENVLNAYSAVEGNIEDDEEDYENEEAGYQYHKKNDYILANVHSPKSESFDDAVPRTCGSAVTLNENGNISNSTAIPPASENISMNSDSSSYVHVASPNSESLKSSLQNVSIEEKHNTKQIPSHDHTQKLAARNTSRVQVYSEDANHSYEPVPISSYYFGNRNDDIDIEDDPTPYPSQHVLKQYRQGQQLGLQKDVVETLEDLKPRTIAHPTLYPVKSHQSDSGPTSEANSTFSYFDFRKGDNLYISEGVDLGCDPSIDDSQYYPTKSDSSSGIVDSAGGVCKVLKSLSSTESPGNTTNSEETELNISLSNEDYIYSQAESCAFDETGIPVENIAVDSNDNDSPSPLLVPKSNNTAVDSHNIKRPETTNNKDGKRIISRTTELLLKRQASGGPEKGGAATVSVTDVFKNEHMPAPVIVDEETGEPLVLYPASIPVQLKLPPLLSKKNQQKVKALKTRASARINRPKTFVIPPPPVWTVDPTSVPVGLQDRRRSSSGSISIMLNRQRSTGGAGVFMDANTTIKIKRRKSSTDTLNALSAEESTNLYQLGSQGEQVELKSKETLVNEKLKEFCDTDSMNSNQLEKDNNKGIDATSDKSNQENFNKNDDIGTRVVRPRKNSTVGFVLDTLKDDDSITDSNSELGRSNSQKPSDRKHHMRQASTVSKKSYIEGDEDAWDDGIQEGGGYGGNKEEHETVDAGHFLNDEILSDCATLPSDDEYQEEDLDSDEEDGNDAEKNGAIGNDRNITDFAFTSFDPNAPITERGLLGGSISYSSGIFPSVGVQPQTLVEELELRKAERKARAQKVYYDSNTGNAIAAEIYGSEDPDPEKLIRLQTSEHPLDDRHNKSLLELQEIARMNYREDLQLRRNVKNAMEITRQMHLFGGVNGNKALLNQFGLLKNDSSKVDQILEEKPDETLKERRARLKKLKREQAAAAAMEAEEDTKNFVDGEDDENEPPGETLAERRSRLKKRRKMMKETQELQEKKEMKIEYTNEDQGYLMKSEQVQLVHEYGVNEQPAYLRNGIAV